MKKYRVEFKIDNKEQYAGFEPHSDIYDTLDDFVEAENEQEAILLAIEYLCFTIPNETIRGEDFIKVCDEESEVSEYYYDFKIKVVEE